MAELSKARALPFGASEDWQLQLANKVGGLAEALKPFPKKSDLAMPGRHNLLNAAAALTAAALVRADLDKVEQALRSFKGTERRLQIIQSGEVLVIDDYAHHPSEIVASLTALRERYFDLESTRKRLIVVFQPHLYSRTEPLISEFAQALSLADEVVLTDIYPAREAPIPGVSSARIAELVSKPVQYIPSRRLLPREVARFVQSGDVVVGMGAGTIGEFAPALVKELDRAARLKSGERRLRVAVVYGGESAEREVSLHSGRAVFEALEGIGYEPILVDITELALSGGSTKLFVGEERVDVAFLAVHGTGAEDGAVQGFLEQFHIPYTGSSILASAIAMNKSATKRMLEASGIRTPKGRLLKGKDDVVDLPLPLIVKPNAQGSTVGLSFVYDPAELCPALRRAFSYDKEVLVEELVAGMEISTPVLDGVALTPVEIVPDSGRYDFASKYLVGATNEIIPAGLPEHLLQEARRIAVKCHRALGCSGATRTDAIVRGEEIVVLEVNTLPGMTKTSLLPNSAAATGIPFPELCQRIVLIALSRERGVSYEEETTSPLG